MIRFPNQEKELAKKIRRLEMLLNKQINDDARGKVWNEIEKTKKELEEVRKGK